MKIKEGYILRAVAGSFIAIPITDEASGFQKSLRLNETGRFLWEKLEAHCEEKALLAALLAEYDVTEAVAKKDLEAFLCSLRQAGLLEE